MQMKPCFARNAFSAEGSFFPFIAVLLFFLWRAASDLHKLIHTLEQTIKNRSNPSRGYAMIT